jgi:SIR2-like domain
MENYHDPIRHLKYLRQSLSQDNKPIGFFISAGCPLSVKMEKDKWPLVPDVAGLSKYINEKLKDNEKYSLLLSELQKAGKDMENVEQVLTFLRGLLEVSKGGNVRGLSEKDLTDLEKSICKIIVSKVNVELPDQETPYHRLGKWINSINRGLPIEIFTTNYDLLMEQALDDLEVPYFDGFVGSRKSFFDLRAVADNLIPIHWSRLWKIHGSINWHLETKDEKKYVYRTSEVKEEATHLIYPSHLKYDESRKMPYLALIDQLNRFIRQKSSFLILCGYSFNDNHLNDTIINALKANPTAMVLGLMHDKYDCDESGSKSIPRYPKAYEKAQEQHNLNIWTFDKAIIGTNKGLWRKKEEEEDLLSFIRITQNEEGDDIEDVTMEFGDFSIFTNFLRRIIGDSTENQSAK